MKLSVVCCADTDINCNSNTKKKEAIDNLQLMIKILIQMLLVSKARLLVFIRRRKELYICNRPCYNMSIELMISYHLGVTKIFFRIP